MADVRQRRRGIRAPAEMRERVTALVREVGPRPAARRLGVSRDAVIGIVADLDVMPGTIALVERALARPEAA